MPPLLLALGVFWAAPDLRCHMQKIQGKERVVVSREQWSGIKEALYKLDSRTLSTLVSAKIGISVMVDIWGRTPGKDGEIQRVGALETKHLTKVRFLSIGDQRDYDRQSAAVSTAVKGDSLYFKWLWVDIAHVINSKQHGGERHPSFDARTGTSTWQMHGWIAPENGAPSSRVFFACENGHLVIQKIEISIEPD